MKIKKAINESIIETLGDVKINWSDNIFDLGIKSIEVQEIVTKINKKLKINIDASDLYTYYTLNELKLYIKKNYDI